MRHSAPSARRTLAGLAMVLALGLAPIAAKAQTATEPHRVRGTIQSLEGDTLTVDTREGETATIALSEDWHTVGVTTASIEDIEPGDYVGIASLPMQDGRDGALEVLIFPEAMAGAGEGSRPWDLEPDSTMTNATVANKVEAADGNDLTLTYDGNEKTITVPEDVPIVTFAEATEANLTEGAVVFVPGQIDKAGTITATTVVVGTGGVAPPM